MTTIDILFADYWSVAVLITCSIAIAYDIVIGVISYRKRMSSTAKDLIQQSQRSRTFQRTHAHVTRETLDKPSNINHI